MSAAAWPQGRRSSARFPPLPIPARPPAPAPARPCHPLLFQCVGTCTSNPELLSLSVFLVISLSFLIISPTPNSPRNAGATSAELTHLRSRFPETGSVPPPCRLPQIKSAAAPPRRLPLLEAAPLPPHCPPPCVMAPIYPRHLPLHETAPILPLRLPPR